MSARAYLDHASSSPLRPSAFDAMVPFLRDHHADPGRVHSDGHVTRVAIEVAREQVAELLGARPREVVFTSGGTEAVNAAIYGGVRHDPGRSRVVTTEVEHSSVLEAARREAVDLVTVGVDGLGHHDASALIAAITTDTGLVSVQLANHEVGTVQTVDAVVAAAHAHGALVHVDACAAIGYHSVDFAGLGADLLSVGAHTWGGPKGVGALVIRRGLRLAPLLVGGMQERARRAGIENIPAIVGFGAAATELAATAPTEWARFTDQTTRIRATLADVSGVAFHGDPRGLPNLVCASVDGVEAEPILLGLDQRGVAIHSGSACSSESLEPSPVLTAMGVAADRSLRISVGWSTTDTDVGHLGNVLPGIVAALRGLRTT